MQMKADLIFGSVRLVQTRKVEGSKIYMGGYAIHLDRDGKEIRRTEPQWHCTLDCGTSDEAKRWGGRPLR